jgi:chromosome segregation ATPase
MSNKNGRELTEPELRRSRAALIKQNSALIKTNAHLRLSLMEEKQLWEGRLRQAQAEIDKLNAELTNEAKEYADILNLKNEYAAKTRELERVEKELRYELEKLQNEFNTRGVTLTLMRNNYNRMVKIVQDIAFQLEPKS